MINNHLNYNEPKIKVKEPSWGTMLASAVIIEHDKDLNSGMMMDPQDLAREPTGRSAKGFLDLVQLGEYN